VLACNEIRGCGGKGRSPICGIYIRYAERLRIAGNRISDNGRPANLSDPLLVGNIGGIVVSHVDGVEQGYASQVRQIPAAVIIDNTVVSPEGRALELLGSGQMLVQSNTLTAHGNNLGGVILLLLFGLLRERREVGEKLTSDQLEGQFRAAMAQIGGSTVLIMNTGIDRNLALVGTAPSAYLETNVKPAGAVPAGAPAANSPEADIFAPQRLDASPSEMLAGKGIANAAVNRRLPQGPVSFSDNMVTLDAVSDAITLSLSSIAIVSLDDVGMHDNHAAMDLPGDFVLANALVLGLSSCRVQGNRFRESLPLPRDGRDGAVLPPSLFSAVTLGLLNATEMNQGTYCFLVLGNKKPRVLLNGAPAGATAELDTNRHTITEKFCARFRALSRSSDG
jgi:hypothetical protein